MEKSGYFYRAHLTLLSKCTTILPSPNSQKRLFSEWCESHLDGQSYLDADFISITGFVAVGVSKGFSPPIF